LLFIALAATCIARDAVAELPPDAYVAKQRSAPEFVEIHVRSVKTSRSKTERATVMAHTVDATVKKVTRTKSGLKPGQAIKIAYSQNRFNQPMPGPSEVPTLKRGKVYPAYLARAKGATEYKPAAGGYSFETVGGESRR
jgi:hypothetical protein